jgi:hypothetical protein
VVGLTPGEITLHSNKDRHICIKTHAKASPENNTWLTSEFTPKGLVITNWSLWHDNKVQSFSKNSRIKLNGARNTMGGQSWCLHSSSSTHSSSQPGEISPGHTSTKALPGTTDYSKAEYTNTQQDLPVGDTTSPTLDMKGFLATGALAEKQQRVCPYFQDFSTSSSWLSFSRLASYCKHKLCNTINQA